MRAVLAIIAGIIAAFAVQTGVDWVSYQLYPAAISDMWDRRQISEAMAARPMGALLLTVLGYLLGGLAGGAVAKLIHRRSWVCWVPVALFALTALVLILAYPIAEWAGFAAFLGALIGGLIANHLVASATSAADAEMEVPADANL
jgi:hypothetical protein